MGKLFWAGIGLVMAAIAGGCASGPTTDGIPAVTGFDAARYMGTWCEVARLPQSFERGVTNTTAVYTLRADGRVDVVNGGLKDGKQKSAHAIAKFKGAPTTGEFRVSFFRPFYGDYRIIRLEPDYSASIVTSSTFDYLWILSRTRVLAPERLESYKQFLRAQGFAVDKLEYPNIIW